MVEAKAEDDEVTVRVLDSGIGLGAEDAERLFELFYRSQQATRKAAGAVTMTEKPCGTNGWSSG